MRFRLFLADKQTHNNECYSEPISEWQMLSEEEQHPHGGENGTDIVEGIGAGDTHLAESVAEEDECDDGSEKR